MEIKDLKAWLMEGVELKGLFQSDLKVGLIHPILSENGKAKLNWIGVTNDNEGQEKAKK